jgi:phosphatidylserine/phosphatidylglycerophosphate/cardiolipin synthase-like enzyme
MPSDVPDMLAQTLEDEKLSRGEKQALRAVIVEQAPPDHELAHLRKQAFAQAAEKLTDAHARSVLAWLQGVVETLQPQPAHVPAAEACFNPGCDCAHRIARLFAGAKRQADVCVFTITDDRIANAILDAHRRGVAVRILSDDEKSGDLGSDIERLAAAGIAVHLDRSPFHMHHKFAIFDNELLLTGSYNWTRGAARDNLENFVLTGERRLIEAFANEFERLWGVMAT